MNMRHFWMILLGALVILGCKPRTATTSTGNLRGMDVEKAIAKHNESRLKFHVLTYKGKADFIDMSKGTQIGFTYRIDIAKDSLILISISKMGLPMANLLISEDTVQMRMPINQTATICDFELLKKAAKMDLDFGKLQDILLGEARLEQPLTMTGIKGGQIELQGSRPPYSVYWNLSTDYFRLEKMRMIDITLGKESVLTYSDFKKVDGQMVACLMVLEATQAQTVRIELHHSGIEFDQEKINFRYRIPESYKIIPCDSMQQR